MNEEALILENTNLIYFILGKLHLYDKREEYYDVGMMGLIKAAKGFDPNKGYVFNTYASHCIKSEVLSYIRNQNSSKRKSNYNTISLNKIIYDNGEESITLEDTLKSDNNIEEEILKKEELENLHIALSKLKERELHIIESSFGLNGVEELTQQELGRKYNVSQAQIARIKRSSIRKLKKLLEGSGNK